MMNVVKFVLVLFLVACSNEKHIVDKKSDASFIDAGRHDEEDAGIEHDASVNNDASVLDANVDDAGIDDDASVSIRPDGCQEGAPRTANRIVLKSASPGARLQGSNSGPTTDFVDFFVVDKANTDVSITNTTLYRYLRYYAPPGSQNDVAEVTFYDENNEQITGTPFGTAGSTPSLAFDDDDATFTSVVDAGGGYVGIDLGSIWVTPQPKFTPSGGAFSAASVDISIVGTNVQYALNDGDFHAYEAPIVVNTKTTITAFSSAPCMFVSQRVSATFLPGETTPPILVGQKTYHLGNSLTDTINPWLKPIADSTGIVHDFSRWTIPGAPIKWLSEHQGEGFGTPEGSATLFDTYVQTIAPIDHLTLQPYSDPDFESQGGAAVGFINTALTYSPSVQVWMYGTWPGQTEWATDAMSQGYPGWMPPTPAKNWEEGVANFALYYEDFRNYVDARVGGKSILIIPGGMALAELKRQVDAGLVPGYVGADFFAAFFEDEVHILAPAQYLVSLVFYSCIYRQSPVGRVTHVGTGLTDEQALVFQQIAWKIVTSYHETGVQE